MKVKVKVVTNNINSNKKFLKKNLLYKATAFLCIVTLVFSLMSSKDKVVAADYPTATLIVKKIVENNNGGTKVSSDFTMYVIGLSGVPGPVATPDTYSTSFPGDAFGTPILLGVGNYQVTETVLPGYAVTYSDECRSSTGGILEENVERTCIVTNSDIPAKLNVVVQVLNDNGGSKVPGDFNVVVTGGNANPRNFPGDESGTEVVMHSGVYSVDVDPDSNYDITYSPECADSLALAESVTCTVNINDIEQTGGGGTGGDGEDEEETPPPGGGGGNSSGGGAGGPTPTGPGSSGGGGTSSGGSGIPTPPTQPSDGEVLGVSTTNVPSISMPTDGGIQPEGQVLGASTELPRTGTNAMSVVISLLAGLLVFVPKMKLKFK